MLSPGCGYITDYPQAPTVARSVREIHSAADDCRKCLLVCLARSVNVYRAHLFHLTGQPSVSDSAEALVSIPDGALAVDDTGHIVFAGSFADLPPEHADWPVTDHRPGFILPGFIDTHVHFPQTFSGDAYGGGQLLDWLNLW